MGNEVSDEFLISLDSESSLDIDSFLRDQFGQLDSLVDACVRYFDQESPTEELLDNGQIPNNRFRIDTPFTPQTPYTPETPFWPQTPLTPETPFRPQTPYTSETPYTPRALSTPDTSSRPQTPVSPFRPIELPQRNLNRQTSFWSVDYEQKTCDEKVCLETIERNRRDADMAENANNILNQLSYLNEITDCREKRRNLHHQISVDQENEDDNNPARLIDRKRRAPGVECNTPPKKVKSITEFEFKPIDQQKKDDHVSSSTNLDINGNLFKDFDQTSTHESPTVVKVNNSVDAQKQTEGWTTYDISGLSSNLPKQFPTSSYNYAQPQIFSKLLHYTRSPPPADNPLSTTSRPEDNPLSRTSRPTDNPFPKTSRPADNLLPRTSRPADNPLPRTSKPENSPSPRTPRPEDSPLPRTSRPADNPLPRTSRPAYNPLLRTSRPPSNANISLVPQGNIFRPQCLPDSHKNVDPSADFLEEAKLFVTNGSSASSSRLPTTAENPSPDTTGTPLVDVKTEPNVKTKLKYVVSYRLKMKGQADIKIEFSPKPAPELTEEEKKKVEHRKQLNKESAARYRGKKEERQKELKEEERNLNQKNMALKSEMNQLLNEIQKIKTVLRDKGYTDDDFNATLDRARGQPAT